MSARTSTRRRMRHRVAIAALVALVVTACAGDEGSDDAQTATAESDQPASDGPTSLSVAIASFDLAVGEDRRLLAGLYTDEAELLAFGDVDFELAHLGEDPGGEATISQQVTASYLAVPGWEPEGSSDRPTLDATDGRGVYAAETDLDAPGYWGLRVVAQLDDGRTLEGQAVFDVAEQTEVPAVGDEAPRTANHTIADVEEGSVEPAALDSRAQDDKLIPDPRLHDTRISDAIEQGIPVVVIVSTPVYCRTNFCGPLVETLATTAEDYDDRAAFVHLEVWQDFDAAQLNDAAATWIQPADGSEGREPWVFLVDADGTIAGRWDNVLDVAELHALLGELPEGVRQTWDDAKADA